MKAVAIVQARMGSTRLPGKVLMPLGGHPVLEWCVRAARSAPGVDEVWVATTTLDADDAIVKWCDEIDVNVWRGSETDVLGRFYDCTMPLVGEDIILRLTGDCPFLDPQVIGSVVRLIKQTGADYCSNVSPRTYPDGLDVEAFTRDALWHAYHEARRPIDRDCVTTWISRNRSRFSAETVINPIPGLQEERWVLDTAEDFEFCKNVAVYWPWHKGPPSQFDILGVLDANPDILNANAIMNERYFDALAEEPIYARSYERSQAQFKKAREIIPLAAQTFSKSWLQYHQPSPLFLSHGQGGLAWDIDGNEYVDLVSALLPTILGARDPDVDAAIRRQLCSGISFSLATELEAQLAETLCRLIPCAEAVRFGKSGTDVTTAAIRLARAFTGRDKVMVCGYHGWADWSMAVSERRLGIPDAVQALSLKQPKIGQVPWGDPSDPPAAVIIEPEDNPALLKWLREMCTTAGIVLIFDEVITGFRFDLGGAQKLYGVTPDLATFGKAMANGMPLSALVGRHDIMKRMEPPDNIFYSGTMFGETLSLAAAIATIKKLERGNLLTQVCDCGELIAAETEALIIKNRVSDLIRIEGHPSFKRLKFKDDKIAALFRKEMVASGTLIVASHNICAAHGPSEVARIFRSYDHTLGIIRDAIDKNDIAERLAGATVGPMVRA